MDNEYNALFQTVENLIRKHLKKVGFDKEGLILAQTSDGKYTVILEGHEYTVKNGTTWSFAKGDKCLVHYINGNENNKIIIAKL